MFKYPVITLKAESAGTVDLELGGDLNESLIAQVLRCEANHLFSKSGKTLTRSEVRGGGRKPWKQKGTGRARAGSIRSPLFRGGAITFGPTGKSRALRIPRKMRKAAIKQLLFYKADNKKLVIIDDINISQAKTKAAGSALKQIAPEGKVLILYKQDEFANLKPFLNLAQVETRALSNLLAYDLIRDSKIVVSKTAVQDLVKRLQ